MRIAITGSTGMIGEALVAFLKQKNFSITRIIRPHTRGSFSEDVVTWDPAREKIEKEKLEDHDCVIHLAGANISDKRWTKKYKKVLWESRVKSTELLSLILANLQQPPRTFISASAIGFYGNHPPEERIDEVFGQGSGFLANVCDFWEKATNSARCTGMRVVHLRTGIVLAKEGGALAKMLPIFKMGLGGILGDGKQMMSWIALNEIPPIILHLLQNEAINGPVNVVSPQAVSNRKFTKTLGNVLRRPTLLPAPKFAIKWLLGEMGETLLLGGANIFPRRLLETGYPFLYPDLKSALTAELK